MSNLNLSWSLRPLLVFIRCIGIHLQSNGENKCHLTLKAAHTWICLLLNCSSQIGTLYFILKRISLFEVIGQEPLDTVTSSINIIIDYSNYTLTPLVTHFILLTIVRPRWSSLINCLHSLECQLDQQFFIKLRRITIVAIGFIILLVLVYDDTNIEWIWLN